MMPSTFDSAAGRGAFPRSVLRAKTPVTSNRTAESGATAMAQEPVRRAGIHCRADGLVSARQRGFDVSTSGAESAGAPSVRHRRPRARQVRKARAASASTPSTSTRGAANSIANGMPSSRRQNRDDQSRVGVSQRKVFDDRGYSLDEELHGGGSRRLFGRQPRRRHEISSTDLLTLWW